MKKGVTWSLALDPSGCCILHIEFYQFNGNINKYWCVESADPQFNIITCCTGQVLCKSWRVVELYVTLIAPLVNS